MTYICKTYRCDDKSTVVVAEDSESNFPDPIRKKQCYEEVSDSTGSTGTDTSTGQPPGGNTNQDPQQPSDIFSDIWKYINEWLKNADIWDYLKAIGTLAGIVWYGSKVLDQMSGSGQNEGSHHLNGTTAYSGGYTKPYLRDVVEAICKFGDIPYDVSLLDYEPVEFTIGSNTSARSILEQLSKIYNFDIIQTADLIKFKHRYRTEDPDEIITLDELGFSTSKENLPDKLTIKRIQGVDLPRSITLTYFSSTTEHEQFSQKATLPSWWGGQDVSISVPMTLDHQKAKDTAELLLMAANIEKTSYKFNTSYKYIHMEPGDIVQIPNKGNIRLTKIVEGTEGILEFEGVDAGIESSYELPQTEPQLPTNYSSVSTLIAKTDAIYIDPLYLPNESLTSTRLYGVIHAYGKENWNGAVVYVSRNNGTSYSPVVTTSTQTNFGIANGILTTTTNFTEVDLVSSISVTMKIGQLSSISDAELLSGGNAILIGRELICFGIATLTGPNTYTLSRLRRGLNGTQQFASSHQENELVSVVSTLIEIPLNSSDVNKTLLIKAVSVGGDISLYESQQVGVQSNNQKLFQPLNASYQKIGNDYKFTWTENIRQPSATNSSVQHDADWNSFAIGILDSSGLVKNKFVTTSNTFTYTNDQQMTDFGTNPEHFSASIVPISTLSGPGYPAIINI